MESMFKHMFPWMAFAVPCTVDIHYSQLYLVHFLGWLSQISWFLSENSYHITGVSLLECCQWFLGSGSKCNFGIYCGDKSVEENGRKGLDLAIIPPVETSLHFYFLSPLFFPNCNTPGDKTEFLCVESLGDGHWNSPCVWSQKPCGCKMRKLNWCFSKQML